MSSDFQSLNTVVTMVVTTVVTQIYKEGRSVSLGDVIVSCIPFIPVIVPLLLKSSPYAIMIAIKLLNLLPSFCSNFLQKFLTNDKIVIIDNDRFKGYHKTHYDIALFMTSTDFNNIQYLWDTCRREQNSRDTYTNESLRSANLYHFHKCFKIFTKQNYVNINSLFAISDSRFESFNKSALTETFNENPHITWDFGNKSVRPLTTDRYAIFGNKITEGFNSSTLKTFVDKHNQTFLLHNKQINHLLNIPYKINDDPEILIVFNQDTINFSYLVDVYSKEYILEDDIQKILDNFAKKIIDDTKLKYSDKLTMLLSSENKNYYRLNSYYNEHIPKIINTVNKFKLFLAGHHPPISCNFCFVGKPGTSKTSVCKAIASELDRTPVEIDLLKFPFEDELYDFIFEKNDYKKCVYIFEEIDSFCPTRIDTHDINNCMKSIMLKGMLPGDENIKKENNNDDHKTDKENITISKSIQRKTPVTLRTLLTLLSGVDSKYEACFLANANDPDKLDNALIRPGRLKLLEFKNLRKIDLINMLSELYDKNDVGQNVSFYNDYMISGASLRHIMNCTNTFEEAISEIKQELNL